MVDINVHGHIIAGSLYLIVGLFMARLCYGRLKDMACSSLGESSFSLNDYGRHYFPEPSTKVLKWIGCYFTGVSLLGYLILTITEIPYGDPLFSDHFHMALYFLFGSIGVVSMLEGYRKVPRDSSRATFAVALAFECLMLTIHSQMKETNVAQLQHQLVGLTALVGSVALLLSIQYRNWLISYVIFLASFIWQAMWWFTIGICFLVEDLEYGAVGMYFSMEGMLLFFGSLTLASKLERLSSPDNSNPVSDKGRVTAPKQQERAALVEEMLAP